jgi:UDP-glucose 4-epimerase
MANGVKTEIKITGQKGFIGTHLVAYLHSLGYFVEGFEGNLLDTPSVNAFMEQGEAQILIHMAGSFDPPMSHLVESNVTTTVNLLHALKNSRIQKLIYISSAAVYGEPEGESSSEDDEPHPNTEYGTSKLMAEREVIRLAEKQHIEYVILRFPGVYGNSGGRGVIQLFMKGIQKEQRITIFGDGNQKRSFLHIEDACRAILAACKYKGSGVFNISSTNSVSLNDIIEILKTKYIFSVNYQEANNNLKNISLDIRRAKKELGYKPVHVTLEL